MNVQINWSKWIDELKTGSTIRGEGNWHAEWMRAFMMAVFEDYVASTSAEEFQKQFGTRGTEVLSHFVKL